MSVLKHSDPRCSWKNGLYEIKLTDSSSINRAYLCVSALITFGNALMLCNGLGKKWLSEFSFISPNSASPNHQVEWAWWFIIDDSPLTMGERVFINITMKPIFQLSSIVFGSHRDRMYCIAADCTALSLTILQVSPKSLLPICHLYPIIIIKVISEINISETYVNALWLMRKKPWEHIERHHQTEPQKPLNFITQDGKCSVLAFIIRHAASSESSSARQFS